MNQTFIHLRAALITTESRIVLNRCFKQQRKRKKNIKFPWNSIVLIKMKKVLIYP